MPLRHAAVMVAMMLPAAAPAVWQRFRFSGRLREVPLFLGSYLTVWALFGVATYPLHRPLATVVSGLIVIAAGIYEFTPLKHYFRSRCHGNVHSGFTLGLYCIGSCVGLMLMMVALGVMSLTWMCVITIIVVAQKLLPAKAAIDIPVGLAIVAFGLLIATTPTPAPGPTPSPAGDHTSHHH